MLLRWVSWYVKRDFVECQCKQHVNMQVSGNHRLDDSKSEQERIKAAGFEVSTSTLEGKPCGPLRVWPGGLAMSRTIGDFEVSRRLCTPGNCPPSLVHEELQVLPAFLWLNGQHEKLRSRLC